MELEEEQIKELDNNPPKFKHYKYPIPNHPQVPRPYVCALSVGARGSGKSYSIVKCIANAESFGYRDGETGEPVPIRTILFSPTIDANPIFRTLKSLDDDDIHNEYTHSQLEDVIEDIKAKNEETKKYREYQQAYMKFKKLSMKDLDLLDPDELQLLFEQDFKHPKDYTPMPLYKTYPINKIILDDCLGGNAFDAKKKNFLVKSLLNSRHNRIEFYIAAQSLKSVRKEIRINCGLLILFKFASKKVIFDDIYEIISNVLTEEQFEVLYNHATNDDHSALVIDTSQKKNDGMFKKNLDVILRLKNKSSPIDKEEVSEDEHN